MNIGKIFLGGERYYVYPIAYHDIEKAYLNKIFYFEASEFGPDSSEFLIGGIDFYAPWNIFDRFKTIKILYYLYLKKFFVSVYRALKYRFKYKASGLFGWIWETSLPYCASEVYERLEWGIPHHICADSQQIKTDFCFTYLEPTQEWIKRELHKQIYTRIKDEEDKEWKLKLIEYQNNYLEWREKMISKGLKIGYLTALDT